MEQYSETALPQHQDEFCRRAKGFGLFALENTSKGLASFPFKDRENIFNPRNLYFGTGLATTKAITQGLPFDFLGMFIGAEYCRRQLGISKIFHEISDTHAAGNGFSTDAVRTAAAEQVGLVSVMRKNLGIEKTYECVLASEYQSDPRYKEIHDRVSELTKDDSEANHYFRFQWAGMAYLAQHRNVKLKVGWLTDDNADATRFDERRFDNGYDKLDLAPLSYAYLRCGRSFSTGRTRVAPYTSVQGEERIMLKREEQIHLRLQEWAVDRKITKDTRQTVLHMASIVSRFEDMFGSLDANEVWTDQPESQQVRLIAIPNEPELMAKGIKSVSIDNLAKKMEAILSNVFDLYPENRPLRIAVARRHYGNLAYHRAPASGQQPHAM